MTTNKQSTTEDEQIQSQVPTHMTNRDSIGWAIIQTHAPFFKPADLAKAIDEAIASERSKAALEARIDELQELRRNWSDGIKQPPSRYLARRIAQLNESKEQLDQPEQLDIEQELDKKVIQE